MKSFMSIVVFLLLIALAFYIGNKGSGKSPVEEGQMEEPVGGVHFGDGGGVNTSKGNVRTNRCSVPGARC